MPHFPRLPILLRPRPGSLVACVALLAAVIGLQIATGSYQAEFGGHPDEAAHYVTGLMVRDYLAAGNFSSPMAFARDYYDHYPKVAFGHWPPVLYAVQAGWMLVFSPIRHSVLLLMALLTGLLAWRVFVTARSELGLPGGVFAACALIALPIVQQYSGMVMAEILLTLLCFHAVEAFGRYLTHQRVRDAAWFGVWASLAILTKQTAVWLALMVPLAVLLTWGCRPAGDGIAANSAGQKYRREPPLMLRWSFWLPAGMVILLCGPWTYLTLEMVRNGWTHPTPTWSFSREAIGFYGATAVQILNWPLLGLAMIGLVARVIIPRIRRRSACDWTVRASAILALLLFHVVMPSALEARYLIPALPMMALLAAGGAAALAEGLPTWLPRVKAASATARDHGWQLEAAGILRVHGVPTLLLCGIGAVCLTSVFAVPKKGCGGFAPVAGMLLAGQNADNAPLVISSDAAGEGMFIAEIAARDARPGRTVIRGSKLMAHSDWMKLSYEVRYDTPTELMSALRELPAPVLVVDQGVPARNRLPHQHLVLAMLAAFPEAWEPLGTFDVERDRTVKPGAVAVYRWRAAPAEASVQGSELAHLGRDQRAEQP